MGRITSISRTISGKDYSNVSATATVLENEDPVTVAKTLELQLRNMLEAMEKQTSERRQIEEKKQETVDLLERALRYAKDDTPF